MKRCTKCGYAKPAEAFDKCSKVKVDGLRQPCKECRSPRLPRICNNCGTAYLPARQRGIPRETCSVECKKLLENTQRRERYKPKPRPLGTSYSASHKRIYIARGAAGNFVCQCGSQAQEWAYQYSDPNELTEYVVDSRTGKHREMSYSTDPVHYRAMCHPCHVSFDKAQNVRADD